MKKGQTLLIGGNETRKIGEGDLILALQASRDGKGGLQTNIDWVFDKETTAAEIKSALGGLLACIEEVFGEKMVTEAIAHYAKDCGHLVETPQGATLNFKSKGLQFKNWGK